MRREIDRLPSRRPETRGSGTWLENDAGRASRFFAQINIAGEDGFEDVRLSWIPIGQEIPVIRPVTLDVDPCLQRGTVNRQRAGRVGFSRGYVENIGLTKELSGCPGLRFGRLGWAEILDNCFGRHRSPCLRDAWRDDWTVRIGIPTGCIVLRGHGRRRRLGIRSGAEEMKDSTDL